MSAGELREGRCAGDVVGEGDVEADVVIGGAGEVDDDGDGDIDIDIDNDRAGLTVEVEDRVTGSREARGHGPGEGVIRSSEPGDDDNGSSGHAAGLSDAAALRKGAGHAGGQVSRDDAGA